MDFYCVYLKSQERIATAVAAPNTAETGKKRITIFPDFLTETTASIVKTSVGLKE